LRTRTRLVLYLMGGFGEDNELGLVPGGELVGEGGIGLGLRHGFSESFGMQARLWATYGPTGNNYNNFMGWEASAAAVSAAAEVGLRFGPYGRRVPVYFGIMAGFGARLAWGSVSCVGVGSQDSCFGHTADPDDTPEGTTVDVDETILGGSGGAEFGVLLGSEEQFDLGVAFNAITDLSGLRYAGFLRFGWAVL